MRNAGVIFSVFFAIGLAMVGAVVLSGPYVQRTPGMAGEVQCVDDLPVPLPPRPGVVGEERFENARHEATHMNQFAVGCDSVARAWRDDPAFRMELEAEATCRGLSVYHDTTGQSVRRAERVKRIASAYLRSMGNTLGFEDVWAALDRWCPVS